jgi:hypothetical protein
LIRKENFKAYPAILKGAGDRKTERNVKGAKRK